VTLVERKGWVVALCCVALCILQGLWWVVHGWGPMDICVFVLEGSTKTELVSFTIESSK
jgi:hypothetical protein